jgi:DNA-binding transcriptional ArsR family regulator
MTTNPVNHDLDLGLDVDLDANIAELPVDTETDQFVEPVEHGAGVVCHIADMPDDVDPSAARDPSDRPSVTLYDQSIRFRRQFDAEPIVVPFEPAPDWLPELASGEQWVLEVTSSRWKAGTGVGDDYSAYYQQHLKLRREDQDGDRHKHSLALHVEILPQFHDLVYHDGGELKCQYGEGTRLKTWSTWADSGRELTRRAVDAIRCVYGPDALDVDDDGLPSDLVDESHKVAKAEAHLRVDIDRKGAVIDTMRQTEDLIAQGGHGEVESERRRERNGWVEAEVSANRWDHLGFTGGRELGFETGLKLYHAKGWSTKSKNDPMRHPKLEAFFSGANGSLPHVDDWDQIQNHLKSVVATHAKWADVSRDDLVADDWFDGSLGSEFEFERPTGRRTMLATYYDSLSTRVAREAVKPNTTAPYDILRVLAREDSCTYKMLVEQTGLARSTVRYHVARLEKQGIVAKIVENPVVVSYDSPMLRREATDELDSARPADSAEDLAERAEARRERRDQDDRARADDGTFVDDQDDDSRDDQDVEQDDGDLDDQDDSGRDRDRWDYLAAVDLTPADLFTEVSTSDGQLTDDDVRVRVDALEAPG